MSPPSSPRPASPKAKHLARATLEAWNDDKASTWAAALAFYTMLSIGPLLFVVVAVCGTVFGAEAAHAAVMREIAALLGDPAADTLRSMIDQAGEQGTGLVATLLGLGTLAFGASGVFAALQECMDTIWHVQPDPKSGIGALLRRRFVSFTMVLGVGFLLSVSLLTSAALAALQECVTRAVPLGASVALGVEFAASLALMSVFFAAIFKVLPDARLRWRDVWVGGFATALLFNVGKILIGLYLGRSTVTSPFGAAGSLALVLLWVYYASQVVFLGGEFTRVYAASHGRGLRPARDAVAVETVVVDAAARPSHP